MPLSLSLSLSPSVFRYPAKQHLLAPAVAVICSAAAAFGLSVDGDGVAAATPAREAESTRHPRQLADSAGVALRRQLLLDAQRVPRYDELLRSPRPPFTDANRLQLSEEEYHRFWRRRGGTLAGSFAVALAISVRKRAQWLTIRRGLWWG